MIIIQNHKKVFTKLSFKLTEEILQCHFANFRLQGLKPGIIIPGQTASPAVPFSSEVNLDWQSVFWRGNLGWTREQSVSQFKKYIEHNIFNT